MKAHKIMWWNLENLFDSVDSPRRSDWLKKNLRSELKGWTEEVRDQKVKNLARVIAKADPDIMGLCEIENSYMAELLIGEVTALTGKSYSILHHDSDDKRGIDIAFAYQTEKFMGDQQTFSLEIMKRTRTRDLFQVQLTTVDGNRLVLVGNHWPARSGGQYESEPYRIMVGETLSYWVERIHEELGEDVAIVVLGDFNDQPNDRSIYDYLLSIPNAKKVLNTISRHYLYNPMYEFLGKEPGTFVFGNEAQILDQFMLSAAILRKKTFIYDKTEILNYPGMGMTYGIYKKPRRFGRPKAKGYNPKGYSDHLPILLTLKEKAWAGQGERQEQEQRQAQEIF